ncbi:hypothetical protein [Sabulicella glaciei]|uniref:Secreted protein n=1 Tax=Sabulicella glaciei TaxID=2984948 RepID=A0ABT3P1E3_9PROT|nr:hypothetical protein [Roseococcus sp. MDT2-1-1]MCW8088216.1 hypothetical protein [Roseococcus sp. MDT2-1-1]
MSVFKSTLALAAVTAALLGTGTASAQACPCMTQGAEDSSIDYGPGRPNNVVGGGRLVAIFDEENHGATYFEPQYEQQARARMVAHVFTSGDGRAEVAWVPEGTQATALATLGGDGSLHQARLRPQRLASR